jgi:hypothetical protein
VHQFDAVAGLLDPRALGELEVLVILAPAIFYIRAAYRSVVEY